MGTLIVISASALVAVSAATAAWLFARLRTRRREQAGQHELDGRFISTRASLVAVAYGVYVLVRVAAGPDSLASRLVKGVNIALAAWVLWDFGHWLSRGRRSRAKAD